MGSILYSPDAYMDAVDALLRADYGITVDDTNTDIIKSCCAGGQPPQECVDELAEKYGLNKLDSW